MKAKRILVVEDDCDIRKLITDLLAGEGYRVISAPNGQQALRLLQSVELPDVILMDFLMPELDAEGFRRIQEMDERLSQIPIVVMSAIDDIDVRRIKLGLNHYVRKPIDVEELLLAVEKAK